MTQNVLNVPYLTQPTPITCQSTCLKMYGLYLSNMLAMSSVIQGMQVSDIWKEINESEGRPSRDRNSYQNMVWWLNKHFPSYKFVVKTTRNTDEAMSYVVNSIDIGFPVMISTNHERTDGHIILVIGYTGSETGKCTNVKFICHDPYGKFNPQMLSNQFGKNRYEGGATLMNGGEIGPGKSVMYDYDGIRRIRSDKHSAGTYFLISGVP